MRDSRWLAILACAGWAVPALGDGEAAARAPEPDWSAAMQVSLGFGYEQVTPWSPSGISAGFALLVRYRSLAAGPLADGGSGGNHGSLYAGFAAGPVFDPAPWARIEILAEGGAHLVSVENAYAGLPNGDAWLPYLGVRATVLGLWDVWRSPALAWARRAGVGLQVGFRTDLARRSVSLAYPPPLGLPPDVVGVGGHALSVALVLPLEW